jgi:hypothetical protein
VPLPNEAGPAAPEAAAEPSSVPMDTEDGLQLHWLALLGGGAMVVLLLVLLLRRR